MKIIKETEGGQNAALNPGDLEQIGALVDELARMLEEL